MGEGREAAASDVSQGFSVGLTELSLASIWVVSRTG